MDKQAPKPSLPELLHALAEHLQASGAYLSAARRLHANHAAASALDDVLSKADDECKHVEVVFRQLRAALLHPDLPRDDG